MVVERLRGADGDDRDGRRDRHGLDDDGARRDRAETAAGRYRRRARGDTAAGGCARRAGARAGAAGAELREAELEQQRLLQQQDRAEREDRRERRVVGA